MMDDWQETAFQHRHVHNKIGRKGRGKGNKGTATFNVAKTFGTYEVECPAANKLSKAKEADAQMSKLEIYRLNEGGNALICELWLSNVLQASVLLAGSRKIMNSVIENLDTHSEFEDQEDQHPNVQSSSTSSEMKERSNSDNESNTSSERPAEGHDDDEKLNNRFETFEKNSFRSPKFWLRWQGRITQPLATNEENETHTGPGYMVFSGNDCSTFQGTISCEGLGWKDVKLSGRKSASRSARDAAVVWQKFTT